jgi:hypothetical protein
MDVLARTRPLPDAPALRSADGTPLAATFREPVKAAPEVRQAFI